MLGILVDKFVVIGIIVLTYIQEASMPRLSATNPKRQALRRHCILHLRPEQVADELFQTCDFFDPNDLLQVKYEMLRRVRVDHKPIRRVAQDFGFSRLSVYQAQAAFEGAGLAGLLPAKRGPRRAHKLDDAVMAFVREELQRDRSLRAVALASRIRERFALTVHPRSIERALERGEKKTP
jgi:transposase